jgi:hypothetical protein
VAVAALALAVAGCSPGGSSASSTPAANPPVSGFSILSVTTGSIPIPAAGGVSATFLTGPGAAPGTGVTVASSATAPANALQPSSVRRAASAGGAAPFYYVTFSVSAPTPASVFVSQVLALASPPAGVTFYEEFDDTTGAPGSKLLTSPAGTVAGNAVTFTPVWPSGSTFVPGHTYTAMFYDVPGIASPTPAASGSPTAAPSGASPSPAPTITTPPPGGPTPTPTPTPTPAPTTASTAFTAGVAQTIAIPPAGESTGTIALEFTSNTTVTLTSVPGLPSGVPSPTTGGVVFFAESITASPAAAVASQSCGTGCSQPIPFTLYPGLNTIASAGGHTFYVAECSPTACPVSPGDAVAEPLQGSAIVLTSGSFNDITDFSSTPIWFVFFYQ